MRRITIEVRSQTQPWSRRGLPLSITLGVAAIAASLLTAPGTARAQTWTGASAANSYWSNSANWVNNSPPISGAQDDVIFQGTQGLNPYLEQAYSVNSVSFAANAGAFSLGGDALTIGGGGISQLCTNGLTSMAIQTNGLDLSATQQWNVATGQLYVTSNISGPGQLSITGNGFVYLGGTNTYGGPAGTLGTTIEGGVNVFVGDSSLNSSSLGAGNVSVTSGAGLTYYGASSAGSTIISVQGLTNLAFAATSTAATSTINMGAGDSLLSFSDTATAGFAQITAVGGSITTFGGSSTAGNATVNTQGEVVVRGSASLGSATITLQGGTGSLAFTQNSSGGAGATVMNNGSTSGAGNGVDISQASASGIAIGSLSGSGGVFLGQNVLTLGALGLNDTISGIVQDGNEGGSIDKVGTGTLTLTGNNSYGGQTTVSGGTLTVRNGTYDVIVATGAGSPILYDPRSTLNVYGGTINETMATNGALVNIYGGTVNVDASANGTANIYGGTIGEVVVDDPATINIYGGTFSSAIENLDPTDSIINIVGSNLEYSDPTENGGDTDWMVTGTLQDGDPFADEYFEADTNQGAPEGLTFNGAAVAPEPGGLALALPALGLLAAAGRRRRK